jgi:mannose-6-phosphate isomerase-like protein (cupin superfamily)
MLRPGGIMKRGTALFVLLVAGIWFGVRVPAPAQGSAQPVVWSASSIKWTANPAVKGAMQSVLWGDIAKGPYGALKKVPAGTTLPPHIHSNEHRFVVITGALKMTIAGKSTDMSVGSYGYLPGGLVHEVACTGTAECQYFETSDKAFDSKPAK